MLSLIRPRRDRPQPRRWRVGPGALLLCASLMAGAHASDPALNQTEALAQAATHYRAGDLEAALSTLASYLDAHPQNVPVRIELARYLGYSRRFAEALHQYETALRQEPGNLAALTGVGKVLSWQGDYAASLAAYDRVLARSPWYYDARVGKGFTLYWMGDKRAAYAVLHSCAKAHPEDRELADTVAGLQREFGPIRSDDPPFPVAADARPAGPDRAAVRSTPRGRRWSAGISVPVAPAAAPPVTAFPEPIAPAQALAPAPSVPLWMAAVVAGLALMTLVLAVMVWRTQRRRRVPGEPFPMSRLAAPRMAPDSPGTGANAATAVVPPLATAPTGQILAASPKPQAPALKVLVVDHSPEVLAFVQMVLSSQECEVTCAESSMVALEWMQTRSFDALLLDGHLPGPPAWLELLRWVQAERPALFQRTILSLARGDESRERERGRSLHGVPCLDRPIRIADLLGLVGRWREKFEAA
jgi:tetratricopeptide (TPR) repeat protein